MQTKKLATSFFYTSHGPNLQKQKKIQFEQSMHTGPTMRPALFHHTDRV